MLFYVHIRLLAITDQSCSTYQSKANHKKGAEFGGNRDIEFTTTMAEFCIMIISAFEKIKIFVTDFSVVGNSTLRLIIDCIYFDANSILPAT
ncbi:hypothetical protein T01_3548 [Trichinella spiralis]|uniref:Uncharacterized protein n=1 Tax=Trichinella spiralis TaxID=6334 RepID=A0A0V1AQN5_TRISP|nr:hypothetical protein T01_3548 [Trichinella spiralis]